MNKRIQELAEQAGLYDEKTPEEVPGFTASFEKFAELIVKKCVAILDEDDGATHHRELLLSHFGVAE
jgi:predicted flavoprotein YhiN